MQVVLQGNLKSFPLAQVLMLFAEHGHSGTLDIESGANRARVFFHTGKVIYAESNDGAGNAGESVVRTFAWPEGKFTFLDDVALPDRASRVSLDVESIIAEATKRAESGYADYAMFRVIDNPLAADKISLEADEFKLLFRIGPGKTFGDLASEGGTERRHLGQKLKTLESAGLIARVDQKSESPSSQGAAAAHQAAHPPQTDDAPVHQAPAEPEPEPEVEVEREITQEKEVVTRTQEEPMPAETPQATVMVARPRREDIMAAAASASGEATMFAPPPPPPPPPAEDAPVSSDRTQAGTIPLPPESQPAPPPVPGGIVFGSLMPDSGDSYPLVDDEYTVGRDDTNAIAVRDGSISGKHARIIRNDMGFWVEDVGSRNGTFVNGEKVSEKRLLSNGDLVRFGKVIMTYHIAEETSSDATTVVG